MPPGTVLTEVTSIDVHPGEAANVLKREALAAVLEPDDSEAGEHISVVEVEPDSSTRITKKLMNPMSLAGTRV